MLYALHQQATVGPCTEAKPWGWNVVESAKWESWNQLGNMSSVEAMRLYVKMVEDDQVTRKSSLACRCVWRVYTQMKCPCCKLAGVPKHSWAAYGSLYASVKTVENCQEDQLMH